MEIWGSFLRIQPPWLAAQRSDEGGRLLLEDVKLEIAAFAGQYTLVFERRKTHLKYPRRDDYAISFIAARLARL